jgi:hypothetical protein
MAVHSIYPVRSMLQAVSMKQITGFLLFMASGALLAQQAGPPTSGYMRAAVSVNVSPASGKTGRLVYVGKIEMVDDDLRLQITNDGDLPVIAVALAYEAFGCNGDENYWTVGGADTAREPGMSSVDVPAHGRAWYRDSHMASVLAFSALDQKTRYVLASAQVSAVKLLDGRVIKLAEHDPRRKHARPLDSSELCSQWVWDEKLSQVRGSRAANHLESSSSAEKQIPYTCGMLNGVLTCPE